MNVIFASDLHHYPEDYEPPRIDHPDPEVLRMTKVLMDADVECQGWEYAYKGATQGGNYYEETYRHEIRRYIEMAEAVLRMWKATQ